MLTIQLHRNPKSFNTQPPEGGWYISKHINSRLPVSTHSRLKAAGVNDYGFNLNDFVSTHSRLKAAGPIVWIFIAFYAGFNTQPPEGGWQTIRYNTNI